MGDSGWLGSGASIQQLLSSSWDELLILDSTMIYPSYILTLTCTLHSPVNYPRHRTCYVRILQDTAYASQDFAKKDNF